MTHIHIKNLSKTFGSKQILDHIHLDIPSETSMVILGGSGEGKSVLLKLLLGIYACDPQSEIYLDQTNILSLSKKKREALLKKFGMLFQGGALFDSLTIWENITFGLCNHTKIPKKEAIEIATNLLQDVGLAKDVAFLSPSEISGGMQKRVALARAICTKPKILFFDEPTAGLDPIKAGLINELIRNTIEKLKATAITITHDMHSMMTIADTVAMLKDKKIYWQGPKESLQNTSDAYLRNFTKL